MSSNLSSTSANNGSVKSADTESVHNNRPASTSSALSSCASYTPTAFTAAADNSSVSAHRVADYTTDPVDPNPSYNNTSAEVRVAEHIEAVMTVIEDFDAVMDKTEKDNKEGSK